MKVHVQQIIVAECEQGVRDTYAVIICMMIDKLIQNVDGQYVKLYEIVLWTIYIKYFANGFLIIFVEPSSRNLRKSVGF